MRKILQSLIVAALLVGGVRYIGSGEAQAAVQVVYASPAGGGDGSSPNSPTDLASALTRGISVTLAGGTYRGCFDAPASGTSTNPLIVRPAVGARAVIDTAGCPTSEAGLTISGNDIWVWGVEVTNSDPQRTTTEPGSNPTTYNRAQGIYVYGARDKVINSWVHDTGNGVGLWEQATDTEVYGTVITDVGWIAPDRGHGHGLYVQNQTGNGKDVTDSIVLNSYDIGVHAYGTAGHVLDIHFDGLVVSNSGGPAAADASDRDANLLIGTEQVPANDVTVTNSVLYQPNLAVGGSVRAGYGVPGGSVSITGSYLAGGSQDLELQNWASATVTGNTFYATPGGNPNANTEVAMVEGLGSANWSGNAYYDRTGKGSFLYNGTTGAFESQLLSWDEWRRNSGFDAPSTYAQTVPPNRTIIRPNRYETGRANITVLNWSGLPTIAVDLGAIGLTAGQTYQLWDANNLAAPIGAGTYTGVLASIPTARQLTTLLLTPGPAPQLPTTTTTTAPPSTTTTQPPTTTTAPPPTTTTAPPTTTTAPAPTTTTTTPTATTTPPKPRRHRR